MVIMLHYIVCPSDLLCSEEEHVFTEVGQTRYFLWVTQVACKTHIQCTQRGGSRQVQAYPREGTYTLWSEVINLPTLTASDAAAFSVVASDTSRACNSLLSVRCL